MLPLIFLACGLMGLAVGSFLNVVVYRVPLGLSVVRPGSACPGCGAAIGARDNIPVVSWLALRGRCRACRAPISARYPAVELLTAALFLLAAWRLGATWSLPAELAFVAGSVALAACDLERFLLPRAILYPTLALVGAGLVAAAAATGDWSRLGVAAACGAGAFAAFYALHAARPRWLGFGDVRLAALLGLSLGWIGPGELVFALILANLLGCAVAVPLLAAGRAGWTTKLPYGVFLTAGAVVALLAGQPILHAYGHFVLGG